MAQLLLFWVLSTCESPVISGCCSSRVCRLTVHRGKQTHQVTTSTSFYCHGETPLKELWNLAEFYHYPAFSRCQGLSVQPLTLDTFSIYCKLNYSLFLHHSFFTLYSDSDPVILRWSVFISRMNKCQLQEKSLSVY